MAQPTETRFEMRNAWHLRTGRQATAELPLRWSTYPGQRQYGGGLQTAVPSSLRRYLFVLVHFEALYVHLDGNIAVCCDYAQFEILRQQMTLPQQLLSRCPSCYSNFVNFWCQFTCSPYQESFLNILETANDEHSVQNETYITKLEYFVDRGYAEGLFESCKGVSRVPLK